MKGYDKNKLLIGHQDYKINVELLLNSQNRTTLNINNY